MGLSTMPTAPTAVAYTDKADKLTRYKARVDASERLQKKWRDSVEQFLKYYRNRERVYTKGGQRVIVPLAIQAVDAMFAALTSYDVSIALNPLGMTTEEQAKVAQDALYVEWIACRVQEKAEYAVKDSLVGGLGWCKVTYDYDDYEQEVQKTPDEIESEVRAIIKDYPNPPATDEIAAQISPTKKVLHTLRDRIVVDHVYYDEVGFDVEAKKLEDIRYVYQIIELPYEQVMEDPTFENKSGLKYDTSVDPSLRSSEKNAPTDDEKRVKLIEFWDLEAGTVCTFTKAHDKILRESPNPFAFQNDLEDRNPFVGLVLRSDPGKVQGIGDIEAMKPSIDEANVHRSRMATFAERTVPKVVAKEGVFTEAGKAAMKTQEPGEVVEIQPTGIANQDIQPMQLPSLPSELFAVDVKALGDAKEAIGLSDVLQGLLPVGKKTATAMNILISAANTRQAEKRNRMERFYSNIAKRMLILMQMFYDQDRITRMVEPGGTVAWTWSGEDITMQSNIEVLVEPKPVLDHDSKKELAMTVKNIFGIDPNIDQTALNQWVLEQMNVPKETIAKLIKSPEQAQVDQMQQAQSQAAQAQANQGVVPHPADLPGPLSGDQVAAGANQGEAPPALGY